MQTNKLQITMNEPTSIVADFHVFLNYLKEQPVKLTKTKQQFARKDLRALYELLPNLGLEVNEKGTQSYYPVINLFVELALKLELIKKIYKGSTSSAEVDSEQLLAFEKLTVTEQYITLLKCFWLHADWETLQGALYAKQPANVDILFEQLVELPVDVKLNLRTEKSLNSLLFSYGHFLLYFQYFGFWEVKLKSDLEPKTKVEADFLKINPFLKPLIPILQSGFESRVKQIELEFLYLFASKKGRKKANSINEDDFTAKLKPFFEEGQLEKILKKKEKTIMHGEYVFKVAHTKSCWRKIALQDSHTLLDLHKWIQKAFSFSDDHLYAFYMDNQPFSLNCYNSPNDDQGPFVDDVKIGELYLHEGQQFLYLFDFGDEWNFTVTVEKISEGIENVQPSIRDEKGESPQQYPNFR